MAGEIAGIDRLKEIVLFLGTAGVVMPVVKRLNLSPILGFLAAGIFLGPFVMGSLATANPWLHGFTFANPEDIRIIGEFGVVFLFFMIGLELSLERVRVLRRLVFGLGASQFLISTVAIGLVFWHLTGANAIASLVMGAALAMSSTAIVVPTLAETRQLATSSGRATFAVLLFQDLAVTPLLVMITLIASVDDGGAAHALWTLTQAAIGVVVLIVAGRLVLRPLFHSVALAGSQEFFMAACLLVVVGAALMAGLAGLSMAIGAFVGGLLLAETEFRRQIEATIEPFQGLLLGLFFIAIGARLDLSLLWSTPGQILLMTVALVISKVAVLYAIMPFFQIPRGSRPMAAWLLAPGGEFAFVLLTAGVDTALVFPSLAGKLLVAVTLSMFLIPVIATTLLRMEARRAGPAPEFDTPDPLVDGGVFVVGGGRVGQMVIEMLARHNVSAVAIDMNQRNVAHMRSEGYRAYYGDPTMPAFLAKMGLESARGLVLTPSNPAAVEAILQQARKVNPTLPIVARARDRDHAQKLYEMGVSDAVPETFEASLQLAESVLIDLGVPMGLVIASVHEKREKTRKRLKGDGGDARAPVAVRRLKADG